MFFKGTGNLIETVVGIEKICDGYVDCPGTQQDEGVVTEGVKIECSGRFACLTHDGRVNINLSQKCDGFVDCLDGSDENTENCPDRFQCSTDDNKWVSAIFVPRGVFSSNCMINHFAFNEPVSGKHYRVKSLRLNHRL